MIRYGNLVKENVDALSQAVDLLERLSDRLFTNNDDAWFRSGVGRHMRHIMDFYTTFLEGLPAGVIDYDTRRRRPYLETNRSAAAARLVEIISALKHIKDVDRKVMSKTDGHGRGPDAAFSSSTVGRELQFLAFHAVHHFAMVAMTLDRLGFQTPEDFGIAPSTLAYWQTTG
jgi:uncharacterized damage-inducible protein DinB